MSLSNRFSRLLAAALPLAFPALLAGAPAGGQYRRAAALKTANAMLKGGDYSGAMAGFMDIVIEDPSDEDARAGLRRAAALGEAGEREELNSERASLLAGAEKDRSRLEALGAAKERRRRAWRKLLSRVISMASGRDTVREAVTAYEKLLDETPVYSDNAAEVIAGIDKVKSAFYRTIKKEYPYLAEGRDYADERDLATLLFLRASERDDSDRYIDTGQTQQMLDTADRFRRLERGIARGQQDMAKAVDLYARRRWAAAAALFREVSDFDRGNEEARFYLELAQGRAAAEAGRQPAD